MARLRSDRHPIADATALSLDRSVVVDCLDVELRPAFERSLAALDPAARRGALGGITGHVAASIVEVVLERLGWMPVWHFVGPGRHGVDLLMLGPNAERLFALEVKGTLRRRHWPRMRRGELTQMDVAWLDKADNPAMSEWGVMSEDVYGGIVLVNFAELRYKAALTSDFVSWHAIDGVEQFAGLDWLD